MAAGYIRELIARERGERLEEHTSLIDTLKELFQHFFPGKEFLGPRPTSDNSLAFPVRLADGSEHDINDLSSGEKEVLYGYLRIRSTSPRNSVLLLDEPELHLNARLIRGLPRFYHKHLGRALNNQIWLVTHSDALIRDAVGLPSMSVYHLASALDTAPGENQARNLHARSEVESLIIEMVGDLATYRPFSTILLFEGEASEFDKYLSETLFPDLMANFTAVSAGSKARVKQLKNLLDVLIRGSGVPIEIFSVTDRDAEEKLELGDREFSWDVYHIENYLLETKYIASVLNDLRDSTRRASEEDVERWLTDAAALTARGLVYDQLQNLVSTELVQCIGVKPNRTATALAPEFVGAVKAAQEKVSEVIASSLTEQALAEKEKGLRDQYEVALRDGSWRKIFRGRDVLRRFVQEHCRSVGYEYFRNLVVSRMRDAEHRPSGMDAVLRSILRSLSTPPLSASTGPSRSAVLFTSSEAALDKGPTDDT